MFETNRITEGVAKAKAHIDQRRKDGLVTDEQIRELSNDLNLAMDEYALFQQEKSLASQDGRLTLGEAQSVYAYLGNTPETFNTQPIEVKVVLTQVWEALLKGRR